MDARVEHGGKHRVPTDHVDSRGADNIGYPAVIRATSATSRDAGNILQAARIELEEQVQNATSTTTHEEPMIRADRLFKLRSYLGAVDQRNKLEPVTTTEESSTPRLNRTLSMLMYYILVTMKTLYRLSQCKCERGVRRMEFVREWDPRFVGLLRNVLSCRHKDDIPTQLPVDEVLAHESQSSETVIDDIMIDVNVLRMEDGRVEACLIWESTGIASCIQTGAKGNLRDYENTTVH